MDPVKGILDEEFFIRADEACLTALSRLVDDTLALRLQAYLDITPADNPVVEIIQQYLGDVIQSSTFHLKVLERGSHKVVEKIELSSIAEMRFAQRAVIAELEFLQENIRYIRSFLEPRRKADYEAFLRTLPAGYRKRIEANSVMFYEPRARPRPTGMGMIIQKKDIWTIALKGLKFREYLARSGYIVDGYLLKEF